MTMCLAALTASGGWYIIIGLVVLLAAIVAVNRDARPVSLDSVLKDLKGNKPKNDKKLRRLIIHENGLSAKDNAHVNIKGVATCKISTDPTELQSAANSFLGQSQEEIDNVVSAAIVSHTRAIIYNLDISSLVRERNTLGRRIIHESFNEMSRMGIQVLSIDVQEITDGFSAFLETGLAQVTTKGGDTFHITPDGKPAKNIRSYPDDDYRWLRHPPAIP